MSEQTLSSSVLNAFTQGFANRFVERAVGLDPESQRVYRVRPSDHILAGFLTPASGTGLEETPEEDQLIQDLPQDAPYEQTAIGFHWLAPREAFDQDATLQVTAEMAVYVRRLPSLQEQRQHGEWRIPRRTGGASPDHAAEAEVIPVWTRETLPPFVLDPIGFRELAQRKRIAISLQKLLMEQLQSRDASTLYPRRTVLTVRPSDTASESAFAAWEHTLPKGSWPTIWVPVLDLRVSSVATDPALMRVTVRLFNRSRRLKPYQQDYLDANLYGVRLSVRIPQTAHHPMVFRELPQSFRYDRRMDAVGINAHASVTRVANHLTMTTVAVPMYRSPRLEARVVPEADLTFKTLASDPIPTLQHILEAMREYDATEWSRAVTLYPDSSQEQLEALEARARYQQEISRFQRGIALLRNAQYPLALQAFLLMNQAIDRAAQGRFTAWRLFQLVFIVSQLPGLASREYPQLHESGDEDVDILWFAAGGGKTEAFLGLVLWQAFFDRLRGKYQGVTAFVRFPLRLLTFQQLQRLSQALAMAELIRREHALLGAPFSIGYFVGSTTTPNAITDELHHRYQASGPDPKVQRLYTCPFCGAPTVLAYEPANRLIQHLCTRRETGCPNGPGPLPVYVVDQDVYRFLPTVVVSTVDKFAQFGLNQRFAQLLGRITMICPRHGATFLGANALCPQARALDKGEHPEQCGDQRLDYGPFHDLGPALLIQDELHLLNEELGTFDAHYETAVAEMMRTLGGQPWKVIAATATIENYQNHAYHLYLRAARQFPSPGPNAYESFYYTQSTGRLGRIFLGVLGVGRKHTPAVSRTLALLYGELQTARDLAATDLPAACARYGMALVDRKWFEYLVYLYEIILTYVLTRKGSDQVAEAIESRVTHEISDIAPNHPDLRVVTFNGGASEAEMSEVVQQIRMANPDTAIEHRVHGIVATNVIGHGVDVDRFNVMVFAGFPRLVAEYIQASARVGRTFPGLSIFVATPQSERDRSIFDRFVKFHEYVDRLVDPSALTRWPEPALQRTVPGIIAGYLMGLASTRMRVRLATAEKVLDEYLKGSTPVLEDEVLAWIRQAYRTDFAPSGTRYDHQLGTIVGNVYSRVVNQPRVYGTKHRSLHSVLDAMRSLRDVDEPGYIEVFQAVHANALRRLLGG